MADETNNNPGAQGASGSGKTARRADTDPAKAAAKAEAAARKAEETAAKKAEADAKKAAAAAAKAVSNHRVNFGVHIPETGEKYTKEELENNEEIRQYLIDIGSPAVTVLTDNE